MEKQLQLAELKIKNHHEVAVDEVDDEDEVVIKLQTHKILSRVEKTHQLSKLRLRPRMTVVCHPERIQKNQKVLHEVIYKHEAK